MLLLLLFFGSTIADELVQVQVVWRHGDRTPLHCYPTDPYLDYWSAWPPGELSTIGMSQLYQQGLNLKNRYIDQLNFVNGNYKREEILVESSRRPRCIQSAASNLAAFYSGSKNTHPDDQGWPSQWTPIPIHSREGLEAHLIDPGSECPRADELMAERGDTTKFLEYQALHEPLMSKIAKNSGEPMVEMVAYSLFFDCVRAEKEYRNFTLPSWITALMYEELTDLNDRTGDFIFGAADFGIGDSVELLKLRGGPLLTEILNNMNMAQNGTDTVKVHVYSGHDTTISSILRILKAKTALIGHKNPNFGAMLAFELWKKETGYYVKIVYSADQFSTFRAVTHLVNGCSGGDSCPFQLLYSASRPYLVKNIIEECMRVL